MFFRPQIEDRVPTHVTYIGDSAGKTVIPKSRCEEYFILHQSLPARFTQCHYEQVNKSADRLDIDFTGLDSYCKSTKRVVRKVVRKR